jgi:hypothetical protein
VGEEQREVAAFFGEQVDGGFCSGPERADMGMEPPPELESVKLSLIDQQTQHLFPVHGNNPSLERAFWDVGGLKRRGRRKSFESVFGRSSTAIERQQGVCSFFVQNGKFIGRA